MSYNRAPIPIPDQLIDIPSYGQQQDLGFDRPPPYSQLDVNGMQPGQNLNPNNQYAPPIPARSYSRPERVGTPDIPPRDYISYQSNENPVWDREPPAVYVKHKNVDNVDLHQMTTQLNKTSIAFDEISFETPISTHAPLDLFERVQHELGIPENTNKDGRAVETNKFYGNILIGSQTNPIWTHPYSVWYTKEEPFFGLAVSHCTAEQRVMADGPTPQYFFCPTNIKSFVFSAEEFTTGSDCRPTICNIEHMSIEIQLKKSDYQFISFPLVQGMGFISATYNNMSPKIQSAIAYRSFNKVDCSNTNISKYEILLENGKVWSLYVSPVKNETVNLQLVDPNTIICNNLVNACTFQLVASNESAVDEAAGCYPVGATLSGNINNSQGSYSFDYKTQGISKSGKTLMFALPHQQNYFSQNLISSKINLNLDSTVYGVMSGFITNRFSMENLDIPSNVFFDPSTTIPGKSVHYNNEVLETIRLAATREVNGDVVTESNLDSMYFAGKVLAKYAWILYCCQYIVKDQQLVVTLLPKLKNAMKRFTCNSQILPLRYDTTWGGIISSGTNSQDFGNSYYNDHHFHYAYHVIAAAIIAKVDKEISDGSWLNENKDWVECLIRDFANPSINDKYFPVFRSFDWFGGHSWAKGLFESGDGKDEESTSEDVNASYALKLWGVVTGNTNLKNIGDLQLGILRTSINHYMLYQDDNETQPKQFIANKVSGIFFENKIDHTTYFGNELQYIQMIHAIPIIPPSSFIRSPTFVKEEWEQKLRNIVESINDGWKGIIMLNLALYDPTRSYRFFSDPNFQPNLLDGGQSLTWSLAYSGAFL